MINGATALNNNRKPIIDTPIIPRRDFNKPKSKLFCKKLDPFHPCVQQSITNVCNEYCYQKNNCGYKSEANYDWNIKDSYCIIIEFSHSWPIKNGLCNNCAAKRSCQS